MFPHFFVVSLIFAEREKEREREREGGEWWGVEQTNRPRDRDRHRDSETDRNRKRTLKLALNPRTDLTKAPDADMREVGVAIAARAVKSTSKRVGPPQRAPTSKVTRSTCHNRTMFRRSWQTEVLARQSCRPISCVQVCRTFPYQRL